MNHSVYSVEKLEKQLRDRFEKLLSDMRGTDITKENMRLFNYNAPHRSLIASDIRVSVDDFATILKEIKSSLGKK
jgi:hypothetical protein